MIKVASYCRVSTDREDQANSFEAQRRYFREYIARHPDWELYEIYADEGITGTSTKKRTQFNRMIEDAYFGKFQMIITKEVSRFSRNLLDTIAYTRELKSLGIGVIFMNDGFTSLDPDSELRLSIMGSIAQEESRKTSTRVKWGQTRQMERGIVFGTSLLGYDVCEGKLTINPEGADIVRRIFHKYGIEKKGTSVIAKELREAGFKTNRGNVVWNSSHIVKILRNEKYVGDLVQKKTITPDYLTHAKKINRGEEELITIKNHHEPIIDRELWETVQEELQRRNRKNNSVSGHANRYVFSGKMICGECGARFVSRTKTRKSGTSYMRWGCYTASKQGVRSLDIQGNRIGCDVGKTIRDDLAMEALTKAIDCIPVDLEWIIRNLTNIVKAAITASTDPMDNVQKLQKEIGQILKKKGAAVDAFLSGSLTREEFLYIKELYKERINTINLRLQSCEIEINTLHQDQSEIQEQIQSIVTCARPAEPFCKALLEKVIIQKNGTIHIHLNHIPQVFHFKLEYHRSNRQEDNSPISGSVSL